MGRPFTLIRLQIATLDRQTFFLVVLIPFLTFGFFRMFDSGIRNLSVMDLVIGSYEPSYNFSLLWMLCPIISIICLIRVWGIKDGYNVITRQNTYTRIWISHLTDIFFFSCVIALILQISLIVIGVISIGTLANFSDTTSLFFSATGQQTIDNFSFSAAMPITFVYALLSLLFSNTLFYALQCLLNGTRIAFALVVLMGLATIHSTYSIIYDLTHSLPNFSFLVKNPLSFLYETASVSYTSWLPDQSHQLEILALSVIAFAVLALLASRKREYA